VDTSARSNNQPKKKRDFDETVFPRHYETVARSLDGGDTVDGVENRDLMYVLQAPQSFRLYDIYDANKRAAEEGMMGKFVDQAHMMNHYGHGIHMVDSFRGNIKVTIPLDIAYLEFLLSSGEYEKVTGEPAHQ
jgi:2-C-methyl-D-erythritol 4-phosphate cytidylyltransferase